MTIIQFENFIVLAQERNIAKAARVLFVSSSTLSKQMISLENELGLTLFKRDTSPLELTHAGMLFLETALKVVAETKELAKKFSDLSENVKGHIKLGVSAMRIDREFQEILPKFLNRYPSCCIDLISSTTMTLRDMVLNGELDIAICSDSFSSDQLSYEHLQKEEMLMMVSQSHPLASRAGFDENGKRNCCKASWFENESFLVQSKESPTRTIFADFFKKSSFEPKITIMNCSSPLLLQLAEKGNYCTIYSELNLKYYPNLVGFSFEPPIYQHFCIVKRKNYKYSQQEQFLVDTIREYYSK